MQGVAIGSGIGNVVETAAVGDLLKQKVYINTLYIYIYIYVAFILYKEKIKCQT